MSWSSAVSDRNIRIGFGIPAYGGKVVMQHARMWLTVGHTLAASEHRFTCVLPPATIDVCRVDVARNFLVHRARDAKCDWLLMIDSDTWVEDGFALLEMIAEADKHDCAVVVAAVPRRHVKAATATEASSSYNELMVYRQLSTQAVLRSDKNIKDMKTVPFFNPTYPPDYTKRGEHLIEVAGAATACMAINMSDVEDMLEDDEPMFRFTKYLSEDLDFCERITNNGGSVVFDPRVTAYHLNRAETLVGIVP